MSTPVLFGVLDDRSRLACHLQWYLHENAEDVVHGLSQAIRKRGLPNPPLRYLYTVGTVELL